MKSIIQRVSQASVVVEHKMVGQIEHGFVILLGIGQEDTMEDIEYLCSKISQLRVFNDIDGKMNFNINAIDGNCLVISQFTLFADTKKGNRPSFITAAKPEIANKLYIQFCEVLSVKLSKQVQCGIFGADMKLHLTNDGPVTITIDSKNK